MESATITKVTLRQEKLRSGKLSLYLDFYPPIWNPHIKKMSRREFLGLYLFGNPKNKFELDYNEEIMLKARGIRATRELAIINEEFGFLDRTKKHADFLAYFEAKTKVKYQKWEIVYKHFKDFCNGRCLMKDVTIGLCNDFRTYILKIRVKQSGNIISRNSAAGYWSTFRALLKIAYKEGWLKENVNDYLDSIEWEDPKINYLEIEEVKRLAATPCKVDVLKRASLFACMTGLRISDILQLRWENIELSPDGGYCMRIRTQKTKTQATLPLSDEALSYCGEPGHGMIFRGLSRAHTREPFKKWLKDADIKKKITFHGLRHIYDFDYSSILAVERHQISRVRDSIAHYHNHLYAERDIERLNLALRLLDIIEEDGCCERVGKPFNFVKSKDKEDLYELEDDPESYHTIPVYVNYKNGIRFCKIELSRYTDSKDGALWQSHLRVEKAWHIYHTLRLYFMRSWWD